MLGYRYWFNLPISMHMNWFDALLIGLGCGAKGARGAHGDHGALGNGNGRHRLNNYDLKG